MSKDKGIVIPWRVGVTILRWHIVAELSKRGYTADQIKVLLDSALEGKPTDEMVTLVNELFVIADKQYADFITKDKP